MWRLLVVARVVSLEPAEEACKGRATLALLVQLLLHSYAVVDAGDVAADIAVVAVVFVAAVAADAAVSPVVAPTILRHPLLLSNQRSCH